jgi:hypothetical protein
MALVMRHGPAPFHHRHYEPVAEGEHARKLSLLLALVGLPASAMVWQIWSLVTQGPGADVQAPRFAGWSAVFVTLPATLLVVGVAVAALVLAARACAGRIRHAETALGLTGAGLLIALASTGITVADTVATSSSTARSWVIVGVATAVASVATAAAHWWARP